MNTLSWLLLFSGLSENLRVTFALSGFFTLAYWGMRKSWQFLSEDDVRPLAAPTHTALIFVFVFWAIAAILPSSETIRLIAASEVTGRIVTDERTLRNLEHLETWLRQKTQ